MSVNLKSDVHTKKYYKNISVISKNNLYIINITKKNLMNHVFTTFKKQSIKDNHSVALSMLLGGIHKAHSKS